jgi:hypothetical protein
MNRNTLRRETLVADEVPQNYFFVVHPLDDIPEEKADTSHLGPMPLTTSVKVSLLALRGYLVLMFILVIYHAVDLAGWIQH